MLCTWGFGSLPSCLSLFESGKCLAWGLNFFPLHFLKVLTHSFPFTWPQNHVAHQHTSGVFSTGGVECTHPTAPTLPPHSQLRSLCFARSREVFLVPPAPSLLYSHKKTWACDHAFFWRARYQRLIDRTLSCFSPPRYLGFHRSPHHLRRHPEIQYF